MHARKAVVCMPPKPMVAGGRVLGEERWEPPLEGGSVQKVILTGVTIPIPMLVWVRA